MVDTYTLHYHFEEWECGDECCYDYREWYTVEYKDFQFPTFDTKAEALKFILEREGVSVKIAEEGEG